MIQQPFGDLSYDGLARLVEAESGDGRALVRTPEDNPICAVSYDSAIPGLFVKWKGYATSAQLFFIHETLIHLIRRYRAAKILGDDTALATITEPDQEWIARNWMPRAIEAGLRWAAAKRPMGYFGRTSVDRVQSSAPPGLTVRSFETLDEARRWLKSAAA